MPTGYAEFEFDLPSALLARLVDVFASLSPAPLLAWAATVPNEQGVYQLFLESDDGQDTLVYIGKTDAEAGLNVRLSRHANKVQHRVGLDPAKVKFKAIRVFVFTAVDLETQLIKHYGGTVPWNGSGFGANDPGKNRDTTVYKPEHFDFQYPIDIDRPLGLALPVTDTAASYLGTLKLGLPYLLRYESIAPRSRTAHADLTATQVTLDPMLPKTPRSVISQVLRHLPTGWRACMLPSHLILYKNDNRHLPSGIVLAMSP